MHACVRGKEKKQNKRKKRRAGCQILLVAENFHFIILFLPSHAGERKHVEGEMGWAE